MTPSPYQRDFFRVLAARGDVELQVRYFEEAPGDSPWKVGKLEPWERILPGRVLGSGRVRCHWNTLGTESFEPDVVIVNGPLTAVTTQRLMRRMGGKTPWFFWAELMHRREGARGVVQRFLAKPIGSARAVVAIGERAADDYRRRFPGMEVANIPYACDLKTYREQPRGPAGRRFLFAGQMIERKGVDLLLWAFEETLAEVPEAELHLAGRRGGLDGWLTELAPATREKITMHGFKNPEELPELFAAADVFVLPSRHDGWGVVVNQALAAGLPVITSDAVGAGVDLVKSGVNGVVVPAGEMGPLAAAMISLIGDRRRIEEMGAAAAASADGVAPERAAEKWVAIIRKHVNA